MFQLNENVIDDDDVSLEVNLGGDDSCRASDVSSLSFQNVVLDDTDDIPDSVRMCMCTCVRVCVCVCVWVWVGGWVWVCVRVHVLP